MNPPDARLLGVVVDLAFRVAIVVLTAAIVAAPTGDPRFEDKGLGVRSLAIVLPLTLVMPAYWLARWRGSNRPYPVWADVAYLSVFALDLAGNWFGWYITYPWFDLIPHFHGTGAAALVATALFRLSFAGGVAAGNVGHILYEGWEYYADVVFGTDNVHGEADIINDLLVGAAASVIYVMACRRFARQRTDATGQ